MEKMKLLLVDDEVRYLETTQKLIQRKGYEAYIAPSGEAALKILDTRTIHVVILDVKMPGMDGNETLKAIKDQFPLAEVIMLTGHATVESAIEGMKLGAFDYMMKPCDLDGLIEKLEKAAARKKQHEEKIMDARMREIAGHRV